MALALSLLVLMSWPLIMRYLAPPAFEEPIHLDETAPQPKAEIRPTFPVPQQRKIRLPRLLPLRLNNSLKQVKSGSEI
jgi:hypothetical protein